MAEIYHRLDPKHEQRVANSRSAVDYYSSQQWFIGLQTMTQLAKVELYSFNFEWGALLGVILTLELATSHFQQSYLRQWRVCILHSVSCFLLPTRLHCCIFSPFLIPSDNAAFSQSESAHLYAIMSRSRWNSLNGAHTLPHGAWFRKP